MEQRDEIMNKYSSGGLHWIIIIDDNKETSTKKLNIKTSEKEGENRRNKRMS